MGKSEALRAPLVLSEELALGMRVAGCGGWGTKTQPSKKPKPVCRFPEKLAKPHLKSATQQGENLKLLLPITPQLSFKSLNYVYFKKKKTTLIVIDIRLLTVF